MRWKGRWLLSFGLALAVLAAFSPGQASAVPIAGVDMEVRKVLFDGTAQAGDTISWIIEVENRGDTFASGVVVTEVVPEFTMSDAANNSPFWVCGSGGVAGATCTVDVDALLGGPLDPDLDGDGNGDAILLLSFSATVLDSFPGGAIFNTVSVSSTETDVNPNNNRVTSLVGTPTALPEPATLALFGLGIAGLGVALRRRHSA